MSSAPCLEVTKKVIFLLYWNFKHLQNLLISIWSKAERKLHINFLYIFNIVPEKLFHKSDGVHTKLDMILYLCNAFTYRAKSGTLSSQAWPEGTCTVSGKCHLLVKKCDQILLIPFYITLPKIPSIMLQPIQLCWWAWLDYIIAPCMFPNITITGSTAHLVPCKNK